MRWRKAIDDGSAWVADPDPDHHLAVWQASLRGGGWDWHVIDKAGHVLGEGMAEITESDAKAKAESWYETKPCTRAGLARKA